jgi:hypothetical protein
MTLLTDQLSIRLMRTRWSADEPRVAPAVAIARTMREHPERDLRLALFCGIVNAFVFLDHIPNNVASVLTLRNIGFSGAADVFVFIFGYWSAALYGPMMLERGFLVAVTRIVGRIWRLYATYVIVFVMYIAAIGAVATYYEAPDLITEFNIAGIVDHPIRTLMSGLLLQAKPLNLDLLQLLVALLVVLPPALWLMLRRPALALAGAFLLYVAARHYDWSLPAFPDGSWPFNPFCWQFVYLLGAWFALFHDHTTRALGRSPIVVAAAGAYVLFAFVITMAGHFAAVAALFPDGLLNAFLPNEKANLEPSRLIDFLCLLVLATRFMPKDWRGLKWPVLQPVILCGEHTLAVFCVGVFLSFFGRLALATISDAHTTQLLVSVVGLAMLAGVGYFVDWFQRQ